MQQMRTALEEMNSVSERQMQDQAMTEEVQRLRESLQREMFQGQQIKEGMQQAMNTLLKEKNTVQA